MAPLPPPPGYAYVSNPRGLLSQKVFYYLTSAAHWMTYLWEPRIESLTLILANWI